MTYERDVSGLVEVKTRIPDRAAKFITELVARGYYSSAADFARQAILDKLLDDFELGMSELEPDILGSESQRKAQKHERKGDKIA